MTQTAGKTIHEHKFMQLNAKESEAFIDELSKPIHLNDKLTAALEKHKHRVISQDMAIYALVVDAINDDAQNFYEQFGFTTLSGTQRRLYLPLKSIKR